VSQQMYVDHRGQGSAAGHAHRKGDGLQPAEKVREGEGRARPRRARSSDDDVMLMHHLNASVRLGFVCLG
jgi:hypothetical protein